jgi:hypothetical protein
MAAKKTCKAPAAGRRKPASAAITAPVELRAQDSSPLAADTLAVTVHAVSAADPPSIQPPGGSPEITLLEKAKYLAELEERLKKREQEIEALEAGVSKREQLVDEKSAEIDINVARVMCATAGRSLGVEQPTPAFVGGAMHELGFCNETPPGRPPLKPKQVFDLILREQSGQVSPEIRRELNKYSPRKRAASKPSKGVKPAKKRKSDTSAHAAEELKQHFDGRLRVLKNCRLADEKKSGRAYDRFLVGWGAVIFDNWPQWGDPTGGAEILKPLLEPPPPPPGP